MLPVKKMHPLASGQFGGLFFIRLFMMTEDKFGRRFSELFFKDS